MWPGSAPGRAGVNLAEQRLWPKVARPGAGPGRAASEVARPGAGPGRAASERRTRVNSVQIYRNIAGPTFACCLLTCYELAHVTESNETVTCASFLVTCLLLACFLACLLRAGTYYREQRDRNMCQLFGCLRLACLLVCLLLACLLRAGTCYGVQRARPA